MGTMNQKDSRIKRRIRFGFGLAGFPFSTGAEFTKTPWPRDDETKKLPPQDSFLYPFAWEL